ncbi:MAG: hypothetical protein IH960_14280, partial [Chloroflexi bacterium]|nr:hypothetical protein [Chloroflexota bacterium]
QNQQPEQNASTTEPVPILPSSAAHACKNVIRSHESLKDNQLAESTGIAPQESGRGSGAGGIEGAELPPGL